jgi:hypothetical protein
VQKEIPILVSGEKDGTNMQTINYNGLIPLLVKELNEQKQIIIKLTTINKSATDKIAKY